MCFLGELKKLSVFVIFLKMLFIHNPLELQNLFFSYLRLNSQRKIASRFVDKSVFQNLYSCFRIYRGALWILGEYCSTKEDIQSVMTEVRRSLGEVCFTFVVNAILFGDFYFSTSDFFFFFLIWLVCSDLLLCFYLE